MSSQERYLVWDGYAGPRSATRNDESNERMWLESMSGRVGHFHAIQPPQWLCTDCGAVVWLRELHDAAIHPDSGVPHHSSARLWERIRNRFAGRSRDEHT